jgi:hypothetical protein
MNINELNFKIELFESDVYLVKYIKKRVRNTDLFNEYFFSYNGKAVTHLPLRIASSQTKLIDDSKTTRHKKMRENGIFSLKSTLIRYG